MEKYHFIGIGGIGMSAIAFIMRERGFEVSGSDLRRTPLTESMEAAGITVYTGLHRRENVPRECTAVVVSSAVRQDNPEYMQAAEKGLKIIRRAEALAMLMEGSRNICVAGSHGKTTVTSMITVLLHKAGLDISAAVGGRVRELGERNYINGSGGIFVAEADESDGTFLLYRPFVSVVTNIEDDHLDYYGTREKIKEAFREFVSHTEGEGFPVLCLDCGTVSAFTPEYLADKITYSVAKKVSPAVRHYYAEDIRTEGLCSRYVLCCSDGLRMEVSVPMPGMHNVANSLAAFAVVSELGLDMKKAAADMAVFGGVGRRFQVMGERDGITVVDDYAHHPTEIAAASAAARAASGQGRAVVLFQPHRYSRTRLLMDEFAEAFRNADVLVLDRIYAASEMPDGTSREMLREKIKEPSKVFMPEKEEMVPFLESFLSPGDLLVTMGAGDVWKYGRMFLEGKSNE